MPQQQFGRALRRLHATLLEPAPGAADLLGPPEPALIKAGLGLSISARLAGLMGGAMEQEQASSGNIFHTGADGLRRIAAELETGSPEGLIPAFCEIAHARAFAALGEACGHRSSASCCLPGRGRVAG